MRPHEACSPRTQYKQIFKGPNLQIDQKVKSKPNRPKDEVLLGNIDFIVVFNSKV